jgi:Fe-S-cluster containining protein
MLSGIFEYPKNIGFVCNRCGRCCGDIEYTIRHVLLLKSDADRISKETSLEVNEFADEVVGFEPYIYEMKKPEVGKCIFLKDNRCSIYELRPLICRFYPFELKNLGDNRYTFLYTKKCPGIVTSSHLDRKFFDGLFKKAMEAI